ncbi:MAG: hypothetical protein WCG78_00335 [Candidatus Omnitrophota bacterium]
MNLIDFGFQKSNLFQHMPLFDEILYVGHTQEKVRQYTAIHENRTCTILSLNFIRNDEKILWDAVEDFVKRGTAKAASSVRGNHIFDLLTIDIHKEIETFNYNDLAAVIIAAASRLAPGGVRMIKYSSAYALIHKTTADDWGKITFKTAVDVFRPKPDYLDMLIAMLLKDYLFPRDPVILLLNDLSQNPVFDLQNETQQKRIKKVMGELIPTSVEFVPEVYIQDKNGARELLSGSAL